MKPNINELLDILEREIDCYGQMQTVLTDEEQAIGLTGRSRFDRVQQEKETLVARIGGLERLRRQIVDRLAAALPGLDRSVSVSQLAGRLDPPDDRRLLVQAERLRALIKDVQVHNRRNQRLIDQYLRLVKGSLRLLTNLMDSEPTYQKPGARQPLAGCRPGAGRFIRGSV